MKNFKKWLFYIVYTLVAMGFFFYILFPSETIKGAVSTYLFKTIPGYQIQIHGLQPVLPLGLGFDSVTVLKSHNLWAQIDRLNVNPRLSTLLSSQKIINFRGKAYQGTLRGHIDINETDKNNKTELLDRKSVV